MKLVAWLRSAARAKGGGVLDRPAVCGTALYHLRLGDELAAMLDVLRFSLAPTDRGAVLTLVADRGVTSLPFPWRISVRGVNALFGHHALDFARLGASVSIPIDGTVPSPLDLEFQVGTAHRTRSVSIVR